MEKKEIEKIVELRAKLIRAFTALTDYKSNVNAIMKEHDHARVLHETIRELDSILEEHVTFSN